jgi:hypothetical protein
VRERPSFTANLGKGQRRCENKAQADAKVPCPAALPGGGGVLASGANSGRHKSAIKHGMER